MAGIAFLGATGLTACVNNKPSPNSGMSYDEAWRTADDIRNNIARTSFPNKTFDIRAYGARAGGAIDATKAFANAIAACHAAGGGKVLVSGGTYLSGPIHLLSNVNLHVEKGARIAFITDPKAYLPAVFTRWEGMELMGYSPLIYAYRQENIAITGEGTLDGQANRTTWWPWKGGAWKGGKNWSVPGFPTQDEGREQLQRAMEAGVAPEQRLFAEGANLRPPFVQPYECERVLIEGVTIVNSPFWLLNPVLCNDVIVRGVTCDSMGPNSDGCDPESCDRVLIEDCYFDTGDDCIAIKSGRNHDGRRINRPSQNIVIRNCHMRRGHGGVVIGSEMSGGVRNVFVEHCEMNSPDLERGLRIKTNSVRGGVVENFFARDITIVEVKNAIVIDFQYEEGDAGEHTPIVRNIDFRGITCAKAERVFQVRGYERSPISNLALRNCDFKQVKEIGVLEHMDAMTAENVRINGTPFTI
ncbi:glycoside hydrolase family 28 protein [Cellvibrio japonicus]|nr:glycoside hydrolase family 28 protein [Cellvibrio japonicus]QEI14022.1 glycoside hydrolase family 28 protein [Cellvibrio japonicus]QEI17596.1 glycoside hydrolase family 28 protein [Cellvibrio japonicus]QEI21171.1 glycoside hydrolase family 28 protein [Cellvibrio japonicus]